MERPGLINWIRLVAVAIIWGGAFLTVTIALRYMPPMTVAAGRIAIGFLAVFLLMMMRGVRLPALSDTRLWRYIVGIAILSTALPFALLSWGQSYVSSGFAGMTMAAVPLFVLPLAHQFVPGDQMNTRKTIGFVIGFIGTAILIGTDDMGGGTSLIVTLARVACVAAALSYAFNSIVTKRCPEVNELALSGAALLVSSLIMVPIALFSDGLPTSIPFEGWIALAYLGLIPTAVAFLLKVAVLRSAGPSFMSLVNYMVPIFSVLLGALILSETLPGQLWMALALVLFGVGVSQWPTLKRVFGL